MACPLLAGATLVEVLGRLDAAAVSFRSVSSRLKRTSHTAIINDNSEETGRVQLVRLGRDVRVLIEFDEPDAKIVAFSGRKAEIYYPKIQTVQEYDLGKHKALVEQFLLLGFGTSGKELARNYLIKLEPEVPIDGRNTHHLVLTPKAAEVAEKLKAAELWVSETGAHVIQQKFLERSGNYTLIRFQDLKLNPTLDPEALRLRLPPGVKREYPMK